MTKVLIVEDQAADLRVAADIVNGLGFEVEARRTATSAKAYLEAAIANKEVAPDLVVLDLDLGYDSGHELLRFWHTNRKALKARMVVWTQLGEEQQEVCKLFDVDAVVSKWQGGEALRAAIKPLAAKAN